MEKKICTDTNLDNSYSFSAEEVVNNEDLVRQIFLKLPVRSLIRFKLVSHHWFSLISDSRFARDRTKTLNPNLNVQTGVFFYNSLSQSKEIECVSLDDSPIQASKVRVPSLSFLEIVAGGDEVKILNSSNGLLLCRFTSNSEAKYCVCNPTTKKHRIIPKYFRNPNETVSGFTLVFDPSVSPHYKVVFLVVFMYGRSRRFEIFSSESDKWSSFTCQFDDSWSNRFDSGVYWNGSIHWVKDCSCSWFTYEYNIEKDICTRLDLAKCPANYRNPTLRYFGESKGYLHCVYVRSATAKRFQILERDNETLKWIVKYRVHLCHLLSKFPKMSVSCEDFHWKEYAFSILSVFRGEKEEDSALILAIPDNVVSFNFYSKKVEILSDSPCEEVVKTKSRYHYSTAFNFIESFASV